MNLLRARAILPIGILAFASAACDGIATADLADGADQCSLDTPGETFTFTITNVGSRQLYLTYGCGSTLPIEIDTPDGPRPIGKGSVSFCGVDCEAIYAGEDSWTCSDCGPGGGDPLGPGQTATIEWDRRVYVSHEAPPECSGHDDYNTCALGVRLDDNAAMAATVTVCEDTYGGVGSGYAAGSCDSGEETQVSFQLDLSQDEAMVEVE